MPEWCGRVAAEAAVAVSPSVKERGREGGIGPRETERGRREGRKGAGGGGVNEGLRERERRREGESVIPPSVAVQTVTAGGRTDGRDGGIKRCNHSIVLIERPTGRKRERAREDSMAIRLKKAAQKIALGQKLASKPAGNTKCKRVPSLLCRLLNVLSS